MIKTITQVINEANLALNENGGSGQFRGKWRKGRSTLKPRGYDWSRVDDYIKRNVKPAPGSYLHTLDDWTPLRFQRLRMLARLGKLFTPGGLALLGAELGVKYGPDMSPGPETIKPAGSPVGSGFGRMGW